ncbi:hypothetical protein [Olivibacter sitiensis]|uniref:hypothetical protein n=1 Tax=Olivibacter sitiensis TaxID=376470 RepID=UPI0003FE5607|nr:hypothetical protein [Olivibacter sitiensis]
MSPFLNNIQQIEYYLLGGNNPGDNLIIDAKRIIDTDLQNDIKIQEKIYRFTKAYGRQQLRLEIESVHQELFSQQKHVAFRERVLRLFRK